MQHVYRAAVSRDGPSPPFDSAEFPSHMTPLMLAAIENNYEAVKALLIRGHSISLPNNQDCKYEQTLICSFNIHHYKVIASVRWAEVLPAAQVGNEKAIIASSPTRKVCSFSAVSASSLHYLMSLTCSSRICRQ